MPQILLFFSSVDSKDVTIHFQKFLISHSPHSLDYVRSHKKSIIYAVSKFIGHKQTHRIYLIQMYLLLYHRARSARSAVSS